MKMPGFSGSEFWRRLALLCAVAAGIVAAHAAWAQSAGRVDATHRLVWLQKPDGTLNPVAEGASFEAGDTISTGRASSARLVFADGGEIRLRPDSQLRIEQYAYRVESPQADNAFFRLLKGGMRAVTGLIGKRSNRDAYRVGALTATIGVRGTDYTTRICGDDCAEESRKIPPTDRTPVQIPAARLVAAQGRVLAINAKGVARELEQKSAVYQGDTVRTAPDGYAILVFRDEGRMTLAGGTVFTIEHFRYQRVRPEQNSIVLRLVQGGLRSLTGLIAKRRPESFRVNTVIATIGIRGTGWGAIVDAGTQAVQTVVDQGREAAQDTQGKIEEGVQKTEEQIRQEKQAIQDAVQSKLGIAQTQAAAVEQRAEGIAADIRDEAIKIFVAGRGQAEKDIAQGRVQLDKLTAGAKEELSRGVKTAEDAALIAWKIGVYAILHDVEALSDAARKAPPSTGAQARQLAGRFRALAGQLDERRTLGLLIPGIDVLLDVVGLTLTIVTNMSQILDGVATIFDSAGLGAAGDATREVSGDVNRFENRQWFRLAVGAIETGLALVNSGAISAELVNVGANTAEYLVQRDSAAAQEQLNRLNRQLGAVQEQVSKAITEIERLRQQEQDAQRRAQEESEAQAKGRAAQAAQQVAQAVQRAQQAAQQLGQAALSSQQTSPGPTTSQAAAPGRPGATNKQQTSAPVLVLHTWDGIAVINTSAGRFEVVKDQTATLGSGATEPVIQATTMDIFDDSKVPRPDKIDVDMKDLFVTVPDKYNPGLYVYVRDGKIVLADAGKEVVVEAGEGAYVDGKGGPPVKVDAPLSLKYDPWLQQTRNICR